MHATPEDSAADAKALDLLMPIQFFYLRDGRSLPEIEFIDGGEMPEPYQSLLAHSTDMTPMLREFHESEISLDVLECEASEDYVIRSVVLRSGDGSPIEFGAIGIRLDVFNEPLRGEIAGGTAPLGGLLEQHRFFHSGSPKAYFRVKADQFTADNLDCPTGAILYGRCNALLDSDGLTFADIVEILPPHL